MTTTVADNQQEVNNNDEEEKHFCRLCHGTDEDEDSQMAGIDQEWIHPCKCSGSIKWVHRGCFEAWHAQATEQQRTQCSICSHVFRFSLRLKPRWYAEMPTRVWLLISVFVLLTSVLFYCIASHLYYYAFLYAIALCMYLVTMRAEYRLQLRKLEAYQLDLRLFQLDLRLYQLALQLNELAELVDGGEQQVELDAGPAPAAPTNSSVFEQSGHIQNAE